MPGLTLFFSYSQEDAVWLTRIREHLSPLQRDGLIAMWDDQALRAAASQGWEEILLRKLNSAGVIVVLWSPSFAASDYCQKELGIALARKRRSDARVFLVHLRPTELQSDIAEFQIRPSKDRAVSTEPDPDVALRAIAAEIRSEIGKNPPPKASGAAVPVSPDWIPFYDRSPQVSALEILLDERGDRRNRPLAFVVAGPDREFHEMLHDRLWRRPLPRRLLGRSENNNGYRGLTLRNEELPKDQAAAALRMKGVLEGALDTDCDKLPPGLSYVRARMVAEGKLDRTQTAVLKALLSFLNAGFPDLPAGKALCVGISIEWEKEGPSQRTLRPKFPEEDYPRLALRVVPDLRSPGKVDAHDWVDQVNSLKPGGLSLAAGDILLQMVRGFFGAAESMPMRDLNQKFESLIP